MALRGPEAEFVKAVSCEHGRLSVVDLPDPRPGEGQLVLDVRACGICGSDLHAKDHADELTDVMVEIGYRDFMRGDIVYPCQGGLDQSPVHADAAADVTAAPARPRA